MSHNKWPDAKEARLRECCALGMSSGQIAAELGIGRGAVIGKIHRAQIDWPGALERRNSTGGGRPIGASKPRKAKQKGAAMRSEQVTLEHLFGCVALDLPAPDQSAFACTLIELTDTSCRYPLGDPGTDEFRYCGAYSEDGRYCRRHHRLCYYSPRRTTEQERQQRAVAFKNNAPQQSV